MDKTQLQDQADQLLQQGIEQFDRSQFREAMQSSQEALAIYREIGDHQGEVNSLRRLGNAYQFLGQLQRAIEFYEQSLQISREIDYRQGEANSLNNLGNSYQSLGQLQKAIEFHQQSLQISREIDYRQGEANSLCNLGIDYYYLGQYQRSIEFHEQHLQMSLEIGDHDGEAKALGNLGLAYKSLGQYQRAIEFHQQNLQISRSIGDRHGEAASLSNLGSAYKSLGQYQRAIDFYEQSLPIKREIGNRAWEAISLNNLGGVYQSLGQYQRAIELHEQSLLIKREIGVRHGEADSLNGLGSAYDSLGQYQRAIEFYEQSLLISREIGDRKGEANSLNNLGNPYQSLGQYQRAINFYEQCLLILQEIGDRGGEASSLRNLGSAYQSLGQYRRAIEFYEQSLLILQEIGDRHGEAASLNNLGSAYDSLGQYQRAIEFYEQCLLILQEIGDRGWEAASLNGLGNAYRSLGQYQRAIKFHEQSLLIRCEIGDRGGEAASLNSLGNAYNSLGQYQREIEFYEQSLLISREIDYREGEATSLGSLGIAYNSLGQYQRAIEFHEQHLQISREIGNRGGEAASLCNLGKAYQSLGQFPRAIEFYEQYLQISREIGDRHGETISLNNLGATYYKMGELTKAEEALYESIKIHESLRVGLPDEHKISILETQKPTYQTLQKVLVKRDKIEDALAISERGRARAFIELLRKRTTTDNPEVESQPPNEDRPASIVAQDQNHTLVEYSILDDNSLYIYVVQPSGEVFYRSFDLDILEQEDNASLKEIISKARISLGVDKDKDGNVIRLDESETAYHPTIDGDYPLLQRLHQILIDPIADLLPTVPNSIITFIPDQDLFLVPFAALQDSDGEYLITKHAITIAPSIAVLDQTRKKHRQNQGLKQQSLVVGNPNIHDDIQKDERLYPIHNAEAAARDIAALLRTTEIIGADATKARVMSEMPEKRIIQLFAHALLNDFGTGIPGTIILAPNPHDPKDKGLLNAAEVRSKLKLTAEMVILGCCSSGLGKTNADGVEGLSRCFIEAGTPSIIVSLWDMGVPATRYILAEFYLALKEGMNRAAALRYAMLEGKKRSRNPKSWAPLVLIGETEMLSLDTGTIDLRKLLMTILNDVQPKVLIEAFFTILETGPSMFSGQAESLQTLRAAPTDSLEIMANKIRNWIEDKQEIINSLMDETEQAGRGGSDALPSQDYIDKYNQKLQKNIDRLGMPPSSKSSNKQA